MIIVMRRGADKKDIEHALEKIVADRSKVEDKKISSCQGHPAEQICRNGG